MSIRIGVCAIARNESANLPRFFEAMEALEAVSAIEHVSYSLYENDSFDDTPVKLLGWLKGRSYSLISETLGLPYWRNQEQQRTQLLATARNAALRRLLQRPSDRVLIVDVDLLFTATDCMALLDVLDHSPDAAMACASSIQPLKAIDTGDAWSYYDSWALIDRFGRPGLSGLECPFLDSGDRADWFSGIPVEVQSAFGGLAILRTESALKIGLAWDGALGCEHWSFSQAVRREGSVLAVPLVKPKVVLDAPAVGLRPQYISDVKKLLLNQGISVGDDE